MTAFALPASRKSRNPHRAAFVSRISGRVDGRRLLPSRLRPPSRQHPLAPNEEAAAIERFMAKR